MNMKMYLNAAVVVLLLFLIVGVSINDHQRSLFEDRVQNQHPDFEAQLIETATTLRHDLAEIKELLATINCRCDCEPSN